MTTNWTVKYSLPKVLLLSICAALVYVAFFSVDRVQAAYGVAEEHGYFTGQRNTGSRIRVIDQRRAPYSGVHARNAAAFKQEITDHLNSGNPHRVTGAAFIILTMLGYDSGTPKNHAYSQHGEWVRRIDYLESRGLINWNASRVIGCNEINTAYDNETGGLDDVTPSQSIDPTGCGSGLLEVIQFRNEAGSVVYEIKRDCANPIGDPPGIPPPPPPPTGSDPTISASGSCNSSGGVTISGIASDGDRPGDVLEIHIYYDTGYSSANPTRGEDVRIFTNSAGRFSTDLPSGGWPPPGGSRTYVVYVLGEDASGNRHGQTSTTFSVGSCFAVSCGSMSISPSRPESHQPFSVTVRFNITGVDPSTSISAQLNVPSLSIPSPSQSGARGSANPRSFTFTGVSGPAGTHSGNYRLTTPHGSKTCPIQVAPHSDCPSGNCTVIMVYNKPYVRFYGGDVIAGAGPAEADGSCSVDGSARIRANNRGSSPWSGAGTGVAAFASGSITGFASAVLRNPPTGRVLSFANTSGTYGGNWADENFSCTNVTFKTDADHGIPSTNWLALLLGGLLAPEQYHGSNYQINSAMTMDPGERTTIYIDGNLTINANITAAAGPYNDPRDIPLLRLVVRGDIHITHNVSQIDAHLIALKKDDGSAGTVYTCMVPVLGTYLVPNPSTNSHRQFLNNPNGCARTLIINGAILANRLEAWRTAGSVSSGPDAEAVYFDPSAWLYDVNASLPPGAPLRYDAITNLPPVL